MEPSEGDERRREARPTLLPLGREREARCRPTPRNDLVFEFSERQRLGLTDVALVLTARLQAGLDGRVWVKEIPYETWNLFRSLGLDHLFQVVPGPGDAPN